MSLVTTANGIEESHRKGKLASLIGIEGGHSIGTSLAVLRMFYQLGARYLTLTHTCNTPWADCCKVDEPGQVPHIGGLSHFGTVRFYLLKATFFFAFGIKINKKLFSFTSSWWSLK